MGLLGSVNGAPKLSRTSSELRIASFACSSASTTSPICVVPGFDLRGDLEERGGRSGPGLVAELVPDVGCRTLEGPGDLAQQHGPVVPLLLGDVHPVPARTVEGRAQPRFLGAGHQGVLPLPSEVAPFARCSLRDSWLRRSPSEYCVASRIRSVGLALAVQVGGAGRVGGLHQLLGVADAVAEPLEVHHDPLEGVGRRPGGP